MPLIVLNMGGEMVYILEQRLQAQEVGPVKSKKVLQDVLRTMYGAKVSDFVTSIGYAGFFC